MAIWYFGGSLEYFPPLWYIVSRKIWQPWVVALFRSQSTLKLMPAVSPDINVSSKKQGDQIECWFTAESPCFPETADIFIPKFWTNFHQKYLRSSGYQNGQSCILRDFTAIKGHLCTKSDS
jgi:hypothetical protein